MLFAVEDRYVDTVDVNDLIEKSLPKILLELDPHSTYSNAKEVKQMNGLISIILVQPCTI